jgi:hypothetical protein
MSKRSRVIRELERQRQHGGNGGPVPAAPTLEAKRAAELHAARLERAQRCLAELELEQRRILARHNCRLHVVASVQWPTGEVMQVETPNFRQVVSPVDAPVAGAAGAPA